MPTYCWKCPECGKTGETTSRDTPLCSTCITQMNRDFKAEGINTDFHPTRDLYAERNRMRQKKGLNLEHPAG